jgi:hypothetical protein
MISKGSLVRWKRHHKYTGVYITLTDSYMTDRRWLNRWGPGVAVLVGTVKVSADADNLEVISQ